MNELGVVEKTGAIEQPWEVQCGRHYNNALRKKKKACKCTKKKLAGMSSSRELLIGKHCGNVVVLVTSSQRHLITWANKPQLKCFGSPCAAAVWRRMNVWWNRLKRFSALLDDAEWCNAEGNPNAQWTEEVQKKCLSCHFFFFFCTFHPFANMLTFLEWNLPEKELISASQHFWIGQNIEIELKCIICERMQMLNNRSKSVQARPQCGTAL